VSSRTALPAKGESTPSIAGLPSPADRDLIMFHFILLLYSPVGENSVNLHVAVISEKFFFWSSPFILAIYATVSRCTFFALETNTEF
jgi:energy-converting hydrogenase Eha subunit H